MLSSRVSTMKTQAWIGLALLVVGVFVARELGVEIVAGQMRMLAFVAIGFAACVVAVASLRNWRTGFYFFLVWLMFEDLVRKYMGNSPILFFGKDILLALVYLAFFAAIRRRREKKFRRHSSLSSVSSYGWEFCKYSIRIRRILCTASLDSKFISITFR